MNIALIGIFDGSATDINRYATNVPGPPVPPTWPTPVRRNPVAPLVAGVRLSVTALSYDGVLPITLLANQAITGLPTMAAGMRSALGPPTRGNHAGPGFPALKTSCPD